METQREPSSTADVSLMPLYLTLIGVGCLWLVGLLLLLWE
jgi:hypothetical protein